MGVSISYFSTSHGEKLGSQFAFWGASFGGTFCELHVLSISLDFFHLFLRDSFLSLNWSAENRKELQEAGGGCPIRQPVSREKKQLSAYIR